MVAVFLASLKIFLLRSSLEKKDMLTITEVGCFGRLTRRFEAAWLNIAMPHLELLRCQDV